MQNTLMDIIERFETTRTWQGYETGIHYYWEPNTVPPFWKSQEELTIFEHMHNNGSWILSSDMPPHPPIRVVSSAYLRLLIFLPPILIPACVSSSPASLMMYRAMIYTNSKSILKTIYTFTHFKVGIEKVFSEL